MFLQVTRQAGGVVAETTGVWFFACVTPFVNTQMDGLAAREITHVANIRPLSRVHPHMPLQVMGVTAFVVAEIAGIRFLSHVRHHVPLQITIPLTSIVTEATGEGFIVRMGDLMSNHDV